MNDQSLAALESAARERDDRLDLLKHQVQELEALALKSGELAMLTEERTRLANSGRLAEGARGALELLYEAEDANAHALASRALSLLRAAGQLDPKLAALQPSLDSALISLGDAAQELTRYLDDLEADPVRQAELEQRLASIEALARKHRVAPEQLPEKMAELQSEWQRLEQLDANLAALQGGHGFDLNICEQLFCAFVVVAHSVAGIIKDGEDMVSHDLMYSIGMK